MSFLYPRVIRITRPAAQTGVGAIGYGGVQATNETPVLSGIPASIQLKKEGSRPEAGLPAGVEKRTYWTILIPLASAPRGSIKDRDIVTDDAGARYQVAADYWNSLGYGLLAERLEA